MPHACTALRQIAAAVLPLLPLVLSSGCVTPLVIERDLVGVGVFEVRHRKPHADVRYDRVRGLGLLLTPADVAIGFTRRERVVAARTEAGYRVRTPVAEIATGRVAEEMAREALKDVNVNEGRQWGRSSLLSRSDP